jgi:uncharacterized protein (DUF885 family)
MQKLLVVLLLATGGTAAADTFKQFAETEWRWQLAQSPLLATSLGVHDYDDRLDRVDVKSQDDRLRHARETLRSLAVLDPVQLSADDRVSARVLAEYVRAQIASIEVRRYLMPMNGDSSFFGDLADLPRGPVFRSAADYERYIRRLRDIPRYFDDNIALLAEGLRRKLTVPQIVLRGRDGPARKHAGVASPEHSVFYAPFRTMPAAMPADVAARLQRAGAAAIREAVIPAYAKLAGYLASTYIPGARQTTAAAALPNGEAFYRAQIREFVTLDDSPVALHALGEREVSRIRAEMETIRASVGFAGDLPAFLAHLRRDPQFYAKTPEELLMHAARIAKRIDGALPRYFGRLPRQPYGVAPVPDAIAPFYTGGRYVPAPPDQSGTYWVNTYDLPSRPLYVLPALTLHEAVPGHHLQIALAAENTDAPSFRRFVYFDAFGEGWGLYAEHLGDEMGIYQTPYEQFGRLTYEMWRACRLVVDTGLHALGWTREQAIAFLRSNTALSEHEIETEIDRYISRPGQALAYKVGELKIRELRATAEHALGPKFDLRRFHDAVLGLGSVPLSVLEDEIARWIAAGG